MIVPSRAIMRRRGDRAVRRALLPRERAVRVERPDVRAEQLRPSLLLPIASRPLVWIDRRRRPRLIGHVGAAISGGRRGRDRRRGSCRSARYSVPSASIATLPSNQLMQRARAGRVGLERPHDVAGRGVERVQRGRRPSRTYTRPRSSSSADESMISPVWCFHASVPSAMQRVEVAVGRADVDRPVRADHRRAEDAFAGLERPQRACRGSPWIVLRPVWCASARNFGHGAPGASGTV